MKKSIFVTILLCLVSITMSAQAPGDDGTITFEPDTTGYVGHGPQLPKPPKSPEVPPEATYSGHTLYFSTPHPEYKLTIWNGDTIVYQAVVDDEDETAVLPSYLTGMFDIRLYFDPYCFVGEITL